MTNVFDAQMSAVHSGTAAARPAVWLAVAAGPLFAAVIAIQVLLREGFQLADHPFSLLALGPGGWVQTANFLVCGLGFAIGASAATRSPGWRLPTAVGWLIAVFGVTAMVAGLFPTDPWHGYPVGADEVTTVHGVVHNVAAGIGGLALIAAAVVAARAHRRLGLRARARLDLAVAVLALGLGAAGSGAGDFRVAFLAGLVSWLWASATIATESRTAAASTHP